MLGYAEETRDRVFGLSEDYEIWGINMAHAFIYGPNGLRSKAKPTHWFQLHPQEWLGSNKSPTGNYGRPIEHVQFLDTFSKDGGTVWLQQPDERIPNAKMYPFSEIFVKAGREYATSSFAYQLALLWYKINVEGQPVSDLAIYGINLTAMDEYAHQKPCVEYWLGRIEQCGVKVDVPSASSLLKGPRYARDGEGNDLIDHARERLQHWKENYFTEFANCIVGQSMAIETRHWAWFFNQLAGKFPEIANNDEIKNAVQAQLDKRMTLNNGTSERARDMAAKAHGVVTDSQHWLAMVGGFDQRTNYLPDLRYPSMALAGDVSIPEPKSI